MVNVAGSGREKIEGEEVRIMYYMTCVTVLLFTDAIKVMFFYCVSFRY